MRSLRPIQVQVLDLYFVKRHVHVLHVGGLSLPGENDSWDFGSGAGFYVDATEEPWSKHYKMASYITKELPALVSSAFSQHIDASNCSIFGHSMGGHGALVTYLRSPGMYKSVSAYAPICHPTECQWGVKAFTGYLGANKDHWKRYDATELVSTFSGADFSILIDQVLSVTEIYTVISNIFLM